MTECVGCKYLLGTQYSDKCTHPYAVYVWEGVGYWRDTSEMKQSSCARSQLFSKPRPTLWQDILWCLAPNKKFQ